MANRLSKICTRTGDDGTTGLGDGSRTGKDSLRVEVMGDIDELNSVIGLLLTESIPGHLDKTLTAIQHDLFDLGGEVSIPGHTLLKTERIAWLEKTLDGLNNPLPRLKEFVLPGGTRAAALCHIARAVCRRAERHSVGLMHGEAISKTAIQYLNRLSDLLFVMARTLNQIANCTDVQWRHER
jgi:cob(I)alamin adenosyltransferase